MGGDIDRQDAEIERLGTVDLRGASLSLSDLKSDEGRWAFHIALGTKDERKGKIRGRRRSLSKLRSKYVLAAETAEEHAAWLAALQALGLLMAAPAPAPAAVLKPAVLKPAVAAAASADLQQE